MNIFLKTFIKIIRPFIISCEEATYLKILEKHDKLPWHKRVNLHCHVWRCRLCQRYIREWEFLDKAIAQMDERYKTEDATFKLSDAKKEEMRRCLCDKH